MEQDEIIRRFVAVYNKSQSGQYQITRWPDKENSQSRDCDAYAEASNVLPLAIEHTNVLTFYNQKRDSAHFLGLCGALEKELKDAFQCDFSLIIPVFAIPLGPAWREIKAALREWLLTNVNSLPPGRSDYQVRGVPFPAAYRCVPTPNIDQVWMAFNYEERDGETYFEIRCFLGPESIMDRVNPPNALFGPRYSEYWEAVIKKNSLLQQGIETLRKQGR